MNGALRSGGDVDTQPKAERFTESFTQNTDMHAERRCFAFVAFVYRFWVEHYFCYFWNSVRPYSTNRKYCVCVAYRRDRVRLTIVRKSGFSRSLQCVFDKVGSVGSVCCARPLATVCGLELLLVP